MREKRPEKIAEMLRIHSSGFCHSREQQCSYFGDDHCGQHLAEDAAEVIETLLAKTDNVHIAKMQNLLLVQEVVRFSGLVYVEFKNEKETRGKARILPCDNGCVRIEIELDFMDSHVIEFAPVRLYGKTWRCWWQKPTDTECNNIPWEDET